jgi:hypothetical protein
VEISLQLHQACFGDCDDAEGVLGRQQPWRWIPRRQTVPQHPRRSSLLIKWDPSSSPIGKQNNFFMTAEQSSTERVLP